MNNVSMQISEETFKLITEIAVDDFDSSYNFDALKVATINFISKYMSYQINITPKIKQVLQTYIDSKKEDFNTSQIRRAKNKIQFGEFAVQTKELYKSAFDFDKLFKSFLYAKEQDVKVVITSITKKTHKEKQYLISYNDLLEMINKEGHITGFSKNKDLQELKQKGADDFIEKFGKLIKENGVKDVAMKAYIGSYNRYDRHFQNKKAVNNTNNQKHIQRQAAYLLWKDGDKWDRTRIANLGILKEAHLRMLLRGKIEDVPTDVGENPYYSHELIKYFVRNFILAKGTNIGAAIEEDIMFGEYNDLAVKSGKFVLPGIAQYYKIAEYVYKNIEKIQNKEIVRKEILKQLKVKVSDLSEVLEKEIKTLSEEEIKNDSALEKTIKDFERVIPIKI